MRTELFNVFTDTQILAIKDCIRYGLWGDDSRLFKGDEECTTEYGYCTSDIHKGGNFSSKQISGICAGISKVINENNLNWIEYNADYWDDGSSGMIFFHTKRLSVTSDELRDWASK